ncbi:MAG: protein-L-isoaspartate(D-aspartate) O-methyltransferase [Kofleriaceae bacterium]|nr:protein-L-isoaspartate(D-aspartate) O-methyltransferase [Myxococcales bacterium]MCB9564694.1 protein-L-isoaspartate(D-aspartate) O-methyltransferase [Kofleriaceae bacterium]MCB9573931.1 protein-L-isoaspartate(D-aspartate) O-methyltransferase [Kofleriaceae bacterium]
MVADQIAARGVADPRVLAAMREVPREAFVPAAMRRHAYDDNPVPLGHGQTVSQPYVVAAMTELAAIGPDDRVLEIGTGSGYQTAVLAALTDQVYSIEIVEPLARDAAATLARLGCRAHLRIGDGWAGWPDAAPFDAIIVTAAPPEVPTPLLEQLAPGGRLVIPVGTVDQDLVRIVRRPDGFTERHVFPVRFVPMTGRAQQA